MAAHLVFHEVRRGTKTIGRGWRTPDPSPTPNCSELPGCAGIGEWVEEFVPDFDYDKQTECPLSTPPGLRRPRDWRNSSFGDSTTVGTEARASSVGSLLVTGETGEEARCSSDGSSRANGEEVPAAPDPPEPAGVERRDRARTHDGSNGSKEPPDGELRSVSGSIPPRTVSRGSVGHPFSCAGSCKYAWKRRGCKDGANCDRCHLCEWRRHSRKSADDIDVQQVHTPTSAVSAEKLGGSGEAS